MLSVRLPPLVQDVKAVSVIGDEVIIDLGYRGSAHVLSADQSPKRIVSRRHVFRLPLVDVGETDHLDLAVRLVVAVAASRPVPLCMPEYIDRDIRAFLREIDGRGSWTIPTKFIADPAVISRLSRWAEACPADIPVGWVIGISALDDFGPIARVIHEGRVAMLARDPMIVGAHI